VSRLILVRVRLFAVVALAMLAVSCTADPTATGGQGEPASPASDPASSEESPSPSDQSEEADEPSESPSPNPSVAAPAAPEPPPPVVAFPADGVEGLAEGAAGDPVNRLQQRLTDLGFRTGGVDGAFGPMTAVAVRAFQYHHDLPASGVVDAATLAALHTATPQEVLQPGSTGDAVARLQTELNDAWPLDAGAVDGQYGTRTAEAVYTLQKLHSYPAEGSFGPIERYFMETGEGRRPRLSDAAGKVVEIDLAAQLVNVYEDGQLVLATHTSTGSGETFCTPAGGCRRAVTPTGSYAIGRRLSGWRVSELGELYNPLYFNGGIALHGSNSVPTHPASHGCVRLPMHIAEYAPALLPDGTPVIVG
jgi:peptidoglycan hydrolase-like protein with peptidoglycan-binding domain